MIEALKRFFRWRKRCLDCGGSGKICEYEGTSFEYCWDCLRCRGTGRRDHGTY